MYDTRRDEAAAVTGSTLRRAADGAGRRRSVLRIVLGAALGVAARWSVAAEQLVQPVDSQRRWFRAAQAMQRLAESWGDQPYGAVLVAGSEIIGEGPSQVVKLGDPDAHAERMAIRDAQRRLGRTSLAGSVLYSTSRPCRRCETAAAEAQVARMVYGEALNDAGPPRL